MDYSRKISERLWNQPDKGERESNREQTFIDDIVQKSHLEKEILAGIGGIQTVFDAGAGSGRFSILLAKRGLHVTHFDISQSMIDKAKELAGKQGVLSNIEFVKGALEDLSRFNEKSYDMVISFDSPISYTYPNQKSIIGNLVRLARKKIMFSVSSRLGSLPLRINPLQKNKYILDRNCDDPWVKWLISNKENAIDQFHFDKRICMDILHNGMEGDGEAEIQAYESGQAPWPITYSFMPDELQSILARVGVKNIKLAGPGAFASTFPNELLIKIMNDAKQRADFLDFCYLYDSNQFVCGMGKDNLLACGDKE